MTRITKSDRTAIRTFADRMGATRHRVTADGSVHFFGQMPNSISTGWYLVAESIADMRRLAELQQIR